MFKLLVIVSLTLAVASSGRVKGRQLKRGATDSKAQATDTADVIGEAVNLKNAIAGIDIDIDQTKYASGAELTSIAHSSAVQANLAVQSQQAAGTQADFAARSNLAQAALGAAATAQAALVGKQVLVQELQREYRDAEQQVISELSHYEKTQRAAVAAHEAEQQAHAQVDALASALAAAQGTAQSASQVSSQAAKTVADQQAMIQEAKERLAQIGQLFHQALADLQETEVSAKKAAEAAQQAQANAAAAAVAIAADAERNLAQGKTTTKEFRR